MYPPVGLNFVSNMLGICVFFLCFLLLVLGYVFYGRFAQRVYGFDENREMPCIKMPDGVDYVPLPTWKIFMVQLLNIAGLGPVVGAISGCLFGPVALVWIVVGCIFAGALHDFLAACMAADKDGANLPEVLGETLGNTARHAMRFVCIFLLLMVGVVFTLLPAGMLYSIFGTLTKEQWSCAVLAYYFLATILPIGAIIGRLYPIFGLIFLFMALGLGVMLPFSGHPLLPDLNIFVNYHPAGIEIWPMIFVTIACGAISGFHATQSPMMVRCLKQGKNMRRVFYGAMIVEGMVALVWAVVGLTLRDVIFEDNQTFAQISVVNPSAAVRDACYYLLGDTAGLIAVLGVVVLAITSGDTAMRSCRLMLADVLHMKQSRVWLRLALAIPLFLFVIFISQVDFSVIWRYFGWANQALSSLTLWGITVYLRRRGRMYQISLIPALFMTMVCVTFFLYASSCGIGLSLPLASTLGAVAMICCLAVFLLRIRPQSTEN